MFNTGARKKEKGGGDKDKREPPKENKGNDVNRTPEKKSPKKRKRKSRMVASNSDMEVGRCLPCSPFRSPRKSASKHVEERSLSTTDSGINTASTSEDTSSNKPADLNKPDSLTGPSTNFEPLAGPSTLVESSILSLSGLNTSSPSTSSISFSDRRPPDTSSYEASRSSSSSRNTSARSKSSGKHPYLLKHDDKPSSNIPSSDGAKSGIEIFRRRSQSRKNDKGSKISNMMSHMQLGEQKSNDHFSRSLRPRSGEPTVKFDVPKKRKPFRKPPPDLRTDEDKQKFKEQFLASLEPVDPKEGTSRDHQEREEIDPQEGTSKGPSQKSQKGASKYIPLSKESSDESEEIGGAAAAAPPAEVDPDPNSKEKPKTSKFMGGFSRVRRASIERVTSFFKKKSKDNKDSANVNESNQPKENECKLPEEPEDDSPSDGENDSKARKRRKKLTRQHCVDRVESSTSSEEDIADK